MDEVFIAWFVLGVIFVLSGMSSPIIFGVLAFVFVPTGHFTGSFLISFICSAVVYFAIWMSIGHSIGSMLGGQTKK